MEVRLDLWFYVPCTHSFLVLFPLLIYILMSIVQYIINSDFSLITFRDVSFPKLKNSNPNYMWLYQDYAVNVKHSYALYDDLTFICLHAAEGHNYYLDE